jgi:murein L,D-transpeptidase YcbB/YkuD
VARRLSRAFALAIGAAALGLALGAGSASAQTTSWFEAGRPAAQAHEAVALLAAAASHGLDPADYGSAALRDAVDAASRGASNDAAAAARLDAALTEAMQRYLDDLHRGRVDPRRIHHDFTPRRDGFDAAAELRAALAARRLGAAVDAAVSQLPLYARLREALATYRALADHPAWRTPLPPLPRGAAGKIEPGQAYAAVALLAQRLAALGDLPGTTPAPPGYEGALVDAVRAFQRRHALEPDGVIGRATLAALQVPPAARVRQIELTLERLRWTPLLQAQRMVVINIPEFVLRAYEVRDGRIQVRAEMKVIVGKALDTRTPVFDEEMRFIEFSPYWNVPPSIARNELVPQLRRNPSEWAREGYEFVGSDGRIETALSSAGLAEVLAGRLRIRQRPGPRNALGGIKFVFPNRDNIYLHDTPAARLFARDRRDFSHGCIRVEQPLALARFVLQATPAWTEERIRQAMDAGQSATLRLAEPVPVLIAYGTALVRDGRIHFFDDVYGHDRALDAALRQRSENPAPIRR